VPVNVTRAEIVLDVTLPDMGEDRLSPLRSPFPSRRHILATHASRHIPQVLSPQQRSLSHGTRAFLMVQQRALRKRQYRKQAAKDRADVRRAEAVERSQRLSPEHRRRERQATLLRIKAGQP